MIIIKQNVSLLNHTQNTSIKAFATRMLMAVTLSAAIMSTNATGSLTINVNGSYAPILSSPKPINSYGFQIESGRLGYQFFIDLERCLLSCGELAKAHPIATLCAIIATAVVTPTIYHLSRAEEPWCKEKKRSFDPKKWLKDCQKA